MEENPAPVPVPAHMLRPFVEDWVAPDEDPKPKYPHNEPRHVPAEEVVVWRFARVAAERWSRDTRRWLREHPNVDRGDLSFVAFRNWKVLGTGEGRNLQWRDRDAFLARTTAGSRIRGRQPLR